MTRLKLANLIRWKTKTNTTTFANSDILPLANTFKDEIASLITERNQMYFAVPADDDLVANQREYAFPDDMLNSIIKVEAKFSSSESYKQVKPITEYSGSETESEIVKYFTNDEPKYLVRRRAVLLLSGTISAVTDGIRIWYLQYPSDWSDVTDDTTDMSTDPSTTTAGFPRQFHELLARRVSIEYKERNNKPLSAKEKMFDQDLGRQLAAIEPINLDLEMQGELPSREDQGDYGFNY